MPDLQDKEPRSWGLLLVITAIILTTFNLVQAVAFEANYNSLYTSSFIESIGYISPALASNCISTRNPILETSCITDTPGGYCLHFSCGMVTPPNPIDVS